MTVTISQNNYMQIKIQLQTLE